MRLEAEIEFESVVRGWPGVLDGRGVDRCCVLGEGCPVGWGELMVVLDGDVMIGDAGEGGCDAEVVDEPLPRSVDSGGGVEVAFESVCLVAPDGPAGGPGGYRSEHIEVQLGGVVGESVHAVGTGVMECGVELADVETKCVPLCCGGCEFHRPGRLMVVDVGEALSG